MARTAWFITVPVLAVLAISQPRASFAEPLHHAAEEGHLAVVELLIARGAKIELGEINGVTPLTRAGWKENWDVFAALKRAGAACQSRDLVGDWLYERCVAFGE